MKKNAYFLLIFLLFLTGCMNDIQSENTQSNPSEAYSFIHTSHQTNQSVANEVKEYINELEMFNEMYAVNTDSKILVAIQPKHRDRFQLKPFTKRLENEIKGKADSMKVEVSLDKKIALELEKLEGKLANESISSKQLEKELDRIIKLSKEQT